MESSITIVLLNEIVKVVVIVTQIDETLDSISGTVNDVLTFVSGSVIGKSSRIDTSIETVHDVLTLECNVL